LNLRSHLRHKPCLIDQETIVVSFPDQFMIVPRLDLENKLATIYGNQLRQGSNFNPHGCGSQVMHINMPSHGRLAGRQVPAQRNDSRTLHQTHQCRGREYW
jgi:hypothetical protein